jgi:hypothetical protein
VPDRSAEVAREPASAPTETAAVPDHLPEDPHLLPAPSEWFASDAERHYLDRPRFCPMCATSLGEHGGIATEYWTADTRNFMTWCGACGWFGEVVRFDRVTITEADH